MAKEEGRELVAEQQDKYTNGPLVALCCNLGYEPNKGPRLLWYLIDPDVVQKKKKSESKEEEVGAPCRENLSPLLRSFEGPWEAPPFGFSCVSVGGGSEIYVIGGNKDYEYWKLDGMGQDAPSTSIYSSVVSCNLQSVGFDDNEFDADAHVAVLWTPETEMLTQRYRPAVLAINNRIYVFGSAHGRTSSPRVPFAEFFDRTSRTWSPLPDPPLTYKYVSIFYTAFVHPNKHIILRTVGDVLSLNLETHKWKRVSASHPDFSSYMGDYSVVLDNILYVVHFDTQHELHAYDLNNNAWYPKQVLGLNAFAYVSKCFLLLRGKKALCLVCCNFQSFSPVSASVFCLTFNIEQVECPETGDVDLHARHICKTTTHAIAGDPMSCLWVRGNKKKKNEEEKKKKNEKKKKKKKKNNKNMNMNKKEEVKAGEHGHGSAALYI